MRAARQQQTTGEASLLSKFTDAGRHGQCASEEAAPPEWQMSGGQYHSQSMKTLPYESEVERASFQTSSLADLPSYSGRNDDSEVNHAFDCPTSHWLGRSESDNFFTAPKKIWKPPPKKLTEDRACSPSGKLSRPYSPPGKQIVCPSSPLRKQSRAWNPTGKQTVCPSSPLGKQSRACSPPGKQSLPSSPPGKQSCSGVSELRARFQRKRSSSLTDLSRAVAETNFLVEEDEQVNRQDELLGGGRATTKAVKAVPVQQKEEMKGEEIAFQNSVSLTGAFQPLDPEEQSRSSDAGRGGRRSAARASKPVPSKPKEENRREKFGRQRSSSLTDLHQATQEHVSQPSNSRGSRRDTTKDLKSVAVRRKDDTELKRERGQTSSLANLPTFSGGDDDSEVNHAHDCPGSLWLGRSDTVWLGQSESSDYITAPKKIWKPPPKKLTEDRACSPSGKLSRPYSQTVYPSSPSGKPSRACSPPGKLSRPCSPPGKPSSSGVSELRARFQRKKSSSLTDLSLAAAETTTKLKEELNTPPNAWSDSVETTGPPAATQEPNNKPQPTDDKREKFARRRSVSLTDVSQLKEANELSNRADELLSRAPSQPSEESRREKFARRRSVSLTDLNQPVGVLLDKCPSRPDEWLGKWKDTARVWKPFSAAQPKEDNKREQFGRKRSSSLTDLHRAATGLLDQPNERPKDQSNERPKDQSDERRGGRRYRASRPLPVQPKEESEHEEIANREFGSLKSAFQPVESEQQVNCSDDWPGGQKPATRVLKPVPAKPKEENKREMFGRQRSSSLTNLHQAAQVHQNQPSDWRGSRRATAKALKPVSVQREEETGQEYSKVKGRRLKAEASFSSKDEDDKPTSPEVNHAYDCPGSLWLGRSESKDVFTAPKKIWKPPPKKQTENRPCSPPGKQGISSVVPERRARFQRKKSSSLTDLSLAAAETSTERKEEVTRKPSDCLQPPDNDNKREKFLRRRSVSLTDVNQLGEANDLARLSGDQPNEGTTLYRRDDHSEVNHAYDCPGSLWLGRSEGSDFFTAPKKIWKPPPKKQTENRPSSPPGKQSTSSVVSERRARFQRKKSSSLTDLSRAAAETSTAPKEEVTREPSDCPQPPDNNNKREKFARRRSVSLTDVNQLVEANDRARLSGTQPNEETTLSGRDGHSEANHAYDCPGSLWLGRSEGSDFFTAPKKIWKPPPKKQTENRPSSPPGKQSTSSVVSERRARFQRKKSSSLTDLSRAAAAEESTERKEEVTREPSNCPQPPPDNDNKREKFARRRSVSLTDVNQLMEANDRAKNSGVQPNEEKSFSLTDWNQERNADESANRPDEWLGKWRDSARVWKPSSAKHPVEENKREHLCRQQPSSLTDIHQGPEGRPSSWLSSGGTATSRVWKPVSPRSKEETKRLQLIRPNRPDDWMGGSPARTRVWKPSSPKGEEKISEPRLAGNDPLP